MNQREETRRLAELKAVLANRSGTQWEIGDLLLDLIPDVARSERGVTISSELIRIRSLIGDELSISYMRSLRSMSNRFPAEQRVPGVSWGVHFTLQAYPDQIKPRMTASDALRIVERKKGRAQLKFDHVLRMLNASHSFMRSGINYILQSNPGPERIQKLAEAVGRCEVELAELLEILDMNVEEEALIGRVRGLRAVA